ncbi:MAG: sulfatase-like hydrolase/transferase, partial [Bryobacteraceae bacterium]
AGFDWGTSMFKAEDHPDTYLVDRACEYLRRQHDRPFLLVVSVNSPHSPYFPPKPYDTMFDPRQIKLPPNTGVYSSVRRPIVHRGHPKSLKSIHQATDDDLRKRWAAYLGMAAHIDDLMGKVQSTLERGGIRDNTVVLYSADHGDSMGSHRVPDKGDYMFDPVARIPFLLSWPGHIRPQVIAPPASQVDMLPTLLGLCGIADPVRRHGRSFAKPLTGTIAPGNSPVFSEYNQFYGENFPVRAIITEKFKYVHYFGPEGELFDRKGDPNELTNLAAAPDHADTVKSMQALLFQQMRTTNDPTIRLKSQNWL